MANSSSSYLLRSFCTGITFTAFACSPLARSFSARTSFSALPSICPRLQRSVSTWQFQYSVKPMQWQSSPVSLSTILTLLRRELNTSCWWIWLLKARCMLKWYSWISYYRYSFAFSFYSQSNLLFDYSSFSLRIFSLMKSIFSQRQLLFSARISLSSSYTLKVSSMFFMISRSQKEFSAFFTDFISLRFSIASPYPSSPSCPSGPAYLDSSLLTFSQSQSDSSSMKVLLCMRLLSSVSLAYFRRMMLRQSLAFLSPYFELLIVNMIIGNDHIKTTIRQGGSLVHELNGVSKAVERHHRVELLGGQGLPDGGEVNDGVVEVPGNHLLVCVYLHSQYRTSLNRQSRCAHRIPAVAVKVPIGQVQAHKSRVEVCVGHCPYFFPADANEDEIVVAVDDSQLEVVNSLLGYWSKVIKDEILPIVKHLNPPAVSQLKHPILLVAVVSLEVDLLRQVALRVLLLLVHLLYQVEQALYLLGLTGKCFPREGNGDAKPVLFGFISNLNWEEQRILSFLIADLYFFVGSDL